MSQAVEETITLPRARYDALMEGIDKANDFRREVDTAIEAVIRDLRELAELVDEMPVL